METGSILNILPSPFSPLSLFFNIFIMILCISLPSPPSVAPWLRLPACPRHHLDKLFVTLNAKEYPKKCEKRGLQ